MIDLELWCDGSSIGKFGGTCAIILKPKNNTIVYCNTRRLSNSTNNRAEVAAIKDGLRFIVYLYNGQNVKLNIFSDSKYALGVASGKYRAKANRDLINETRHILSKIKGEITFEHVPGHSDVFLNEICNEAAIATARIYKASEELRGHGYNILMQI